MTPSQHDQAPAIVDLFPCPFCRSVDLAMSDVHSQPFIECNGCGAFGPNGDDVRHAVARWNCRAPDTTSSRSIARIQLAARREVFEMPPSRDSDRTEITRQAPALPHGMQHPATNRTGVELVELAVRRVRARAEARFPVDLGLMLVLGELADELAALASPKFPPKSTEGGG